MSYQCGLYGLGAASRDPALVCDGCGVKRSVTNRAGVPASWFMDRKKAPGWKMKTVDDKRMDWCPQCEVPV